MENINDILADLSISRALLLERVKQGIAKEIEQTYAAIIEDITKQLKSGKPIDNARLKQVVGDVKEQLSIELSLTSKFQDLALQERDWIIASTNEAAGFNIFASIPRESTMLALVSAATVEGAKLSEWLGALDKSQKFDAQRAITLGVSTGETNLQIAKRLADAMDVNMRHAMSLAITGAAQISADARMKVWEANENVIKGYQHHSTLDSRTTLICATRDGAAWDTKGKGLNDKGKQSRFRRPPLHFRCILGDTLISTRYPISSIFRRAYKGDIYIIRTSGGNVIKCTPNHPILTDRGFVPANTINKYSKIATELRGNGTFILDNQNNKPQITIENLFAAFRETDLVRPISMPVTAEDFHGDVTDFEVEVVNIKRELWFKLYPRRQKSFLNLFFIIANNFTSTLSLPYKHIMGQRNSSSSFMTRLNLIGSFFSVHDIPFSHFLLRLTSKLNTLSNKFLFQNRNRNSKPISYTSDSNSVIIKSNCAFEGKDSISPLFEVQGDSTRLNNDTINDFVSYSKLSSNICNGTMGDKVFMDDVVDIIIDKEVLTHVYNLENELNYYTANNLINHNCRSILVPVLDMKNAPAGTRSSIDGAIPSTIDFEKWFAGKSPEFQKKYLGEGRLKFYNNGVKLSELIKSNGDVLTLKELREKYS